jgi:5-methylcytosine-specific restriction endonuclease McrA
MVAIQPYFDQVPEPLQEHSLTAKRSKSKHNRKGDSWLVQLLEEKTQHLFSSEVYGAKEVKMRLEAIFSHKCAYCESSASHVTHYDVDHFRAKSRYYWLAYEWSNLILSCPRCNRDKKRALFPLENEQVRLITHPIDNFGKFLKKECHILSATIKSEQSLIIHPALDNPKEHLRFCANGTVVGLTAKGNCSIELYDLNRTELVRMRKKKVT